MKAILFATLCAVLTTLTVAAEKEKTPEGTRELRNECRAHLAYTAALAEEATKPRMALLDKAIELDPQMARAYYNRGVLHANADDLAKARADFHKAVELYDGFIHAHYNLACVHSLAARPDAALASLEAALTRGYRKFDKIAADTDLKNIIDKPGFAALIAKYKDLARTAKIGPIQLQTAAPDERGDVLAEAIRKPDKSAAELARWGMQEADPALRVLSMQLWRKLDVPDTKPALMRGLYDSNGYVNKAAANSLISYGKEIGPLVGSALEDKDSSAPFYVMQILAAIDDRAGIEKIIPFLRDEKPNTRIVAAESLARLQAVSALPQLKAALENVPKVDREQDFYKTSLRRAIAALEALPKAHEK